ncbi:MAG TPA: TOBE domain-containing protein, partial [Blastocatellia bacterium]|nr:TOBE domain-containing protein [Blastocatellia bacterium]
RIISGDSEQGTTSVLIGEGAASARVEIPYRLEAAGERVTVAIPSGDILLAIEEPRNTSARNVLRGRVALIEDKGNRVLVSVESGVTWRASVTRQAASDLRLAPDQEVWLAFKTYSCHVLDA